MSQSQITPQDLVSMQMTEAEHPQWAQSFAESTRCEQVEDDLFAARTVCSVLIAIVTLGALLGALGVVFATMV